MKVGKTEKVNLAAGDEFVLTASGAAEFEYKVTGFDKDVPQIRDAISYRNGQIDRWRSQHSTLSNEVLLYLLAEYPDGTCTEWLHPHADRLRIAAGIGEDYYRAEV